MPSCPQVLRPSARELILAALPAVDELRSTTSRMALLFFQVTMLLQWQCRGYILSAHSAHA
jgi:hypothetical protein